MHGGARLSRAVADAQADGGADDKSYDRATVDFPNLATVHLDPHRYAVRRADGESYFCESNNDAHVCAVDVADPDPDGDGRNVYSKHSAHDPHRVAHSGTHARRLYVHTDTGAVQGECVCVYLFSSII